MLEITLTQEDITAESEPVQPVEPCLLLNNRAAWVAFRDRAESYARRIRNTNKQYYARDYAAYMLDHGRRQEPQPCGLGVMGAQAVRMELYDIRRQVAAEHPEPEGWTDARIVAYVRTWNSAPAGMPQNTELYYDDREKGWTYLTAWAHQYIIPDPAMLAECEQRLKAWARAAVEQVLSA